MASRDNVWTCITIISIFINFITATPLYFSHMTPNGNSRSIRHLPCVSLRTGETGVCMFAFNCVKANGTHLGTCLDRFYFGSCCKINDEAEVSPQDNTIDDIPTTTFTSTGKPIESNDIPDYSVKPKPENLPDLTTTTTTTTTTSTTSPTTTMSMSEFSTFQTVHDSHRPAESMSSATEYKKLPSTTEFFTKGTEPTKLPTSTKVTTVSSTPVDDRNPPATRFPPRNVTTTTFATTTRRPVTKVVTTTPKTPLTTTKLSTPKLTTKKPPTIVTKRPIISTSTIVKRPPTSTKKPTTITTTSKPFQTTGTLNYSTTIVTESTKPYHASSNFTTSTGSISVSATTIMVTKNPITESSTSRFTTTSRPSSVKPLITSTPKPKPPSQFGGVNVKPTKPAAWLTSQVTEKPKPTSPTLKPILKPKPTGKPTKPTKPSKPPTASTTSTTPVLTTSSTPSITSIPHTTWSTTVAKTTATTTTTSKPLTTTTDLPSSVTSGLITWSSNSDDERTQASSTSTSTSSSILSTTQESEEITETQWSPITTPNGWIMIQSPSTKKPGIQEEPVTESKPTKLSSSTEASTASSTTEYISTLKPTVPTVVSSISSSTQSILSTSTSATEMFDRLNMSDYKQVCGRRMIPESRIVGGESSSFGRWPWQISLRQWRTSAFLHKCGAALLNENWAITAAHCVENVPPSDLLLRMGEHDLANEDEPYGFQERRVQIVASHPQFDPRTFEYDLALLRFYEPLLPFQPNLLPICLPDDDEGYVGHTAFVTGWGRLYEDGPLPTVLQEVPVPVINNSMCEWMYKNAGYDERIPHIFICAGWRKGGFDSCEGDSGGPMVIQRPRDKRWILAGVISWGIGCAEPNQPGVYTRISEFREWINQILQF